MGLGADRMVDYTRLLWLGRLGIACLIGAAPAFAQPTDRNNAVAAAEDAFGTITGHDQIGIYDTADVRGFSPTSAGNLRIEGLAIDLQGGIGGRVLAGGSVRVGPAAQGYAFPAPTGIVDLSLKRSGQTAIVTPFLSGDSFGSADLEVDAQLPLDRDLTGQTTAGLSFGVGLFRDRFGNGGRSKSINFGAVPHWTPAPGVELVSYINLQRNLGETAQPVYLGYGSNLPIGIQRGIYPGPSWARTDSSSEAAGLLLRMMVNDWTVRAGLFHSSSIQQAGFSNLVIALPGGLESDRFVYRVPRGLSASWSGEARISRRFAEGPRQHLLTLALRGRALVARYSEGSGADLGTWPLNAAIDVREPKFDNGGTTRDKTHQASIGLSYGINWARFGELTIGLQRVLYNKNQFFVSGKSSRSSRSILPFFTVGLNLTRQLSLYGSVVRGLEEGGTAPGYARNGFEILPAILTRQSDLGLRWKVGKTTTAIIGLFDLTKPYVALDQRQVFGVLGEERHRGLEISLTSDVTSRLKLVAGIVRQQPRVIAAPSAAEQIGMRPIGQPSTRLRLNANWDLPKLRGVTLDGYINHDSSVAGTLDNRATIPGWMRAGLGIRYNFKVDSRSFNARVGIDNLTNALILTPVGSGAYIYNSPRSVKLYLTGDF